MITNTQRFVMIALALTLMMLGGCGKSENRTLATVGDYEIGTEELNNYLSRMRLTFPDAQSEFNKKREVLDSLVVTRLLIQGAYEKNIDQVDEVAKAIEANKSRFLVGTLYQKHIAEKAEATDAEIRDFYNHLEYKVRASHILVPDLDTAQAIFERLQSGENFEQLAFEYSIDPDAKRNKGDLGYFLWGATVDAFQDAAFKMEPGELSPPIKSRFGYHIIKLVDKRANESRGTFDAEKENIKFQVMRHKAQNLTLEYYDQLKVKYPVTIDTAVCQYLLHKREQVYPPQLLPTLPRNDFDMEVLDRNEKEMVLATWDGGQMSVMEYLTTVKNVPASLRPDFDDYDSLATIAYEMKKVDFLTREAEAENLDQDKEYQKQIKMFKELNMADIMKNDSILTPPDPDESMMREYYDQHIAEYTTPAKIHIYEILLSDELLANKLVKEIKSLQQFKKKAEELTERAGKRTKGGDMGFIEERWYPEIFAAANSTSIGRIGGPVMTGNRYSIFYVAEKIEPEAKDFLEVKRAIFEKMKRENKNQAIQTWVDERLKMTDVEVDDEALWATIDTDAYAAAVSDTTSEGVDQP